MVGAGSALSALYWLQVSYNSYWNVKDTNYTYGNWSNWGSYNSVMEHIC